MIEGNVWMSLKHIACKAHGVWIELHLATLIFSNIHQKESHIACKSCAIAPPWWWKKSKVNIRIFRKKLIFTAIWMRIAVLQIQSTRHINGLNQHKTSSICVARSKYSEESKKGIRWQPGPTSTKAWLRSWKNPIHFWKLRRTQNKHLCYTDSCTCIIKYNCSHTQTLG